MSNPRVHAWDRTARRQQSAHNTAARKIKELLALEVTDSQALVRRRPEEGRSGLEVILANGVRIKLTRDFDAVQLRRAVDVLEGF